MFKYIIDFGWAREVSPAGYHAIFFAFFAAVALFGLMLKREFVYRGAEDGSRWRDLRIWVVAIMAIQAALYVIF